VIEIGLRPDPNEHIIFIRDNGIGFDLDSARKLFQKFGRLHYDETYPGAGIGLLIVKYIIERHQGRVWAEGVPGEGATFCFALPGAS
jgi:light-regulated signal transduction histidine kinase (bacteriophytochrome)